MALMERALKALVLIAGCLADGRVWQATSNSAQPCRLIPGSDCLKSIEVQRRIFFLGLNRLFAAAHSVVEYLLTNSFPISCRNAVHDGMVNIDDSLVILSKPSLCQLNRLIFVLRKVRNSNNVA